MAEQVTAILFACIVALAALWHYHQARIDYCKECPHCLRLKREAEVKQAALQHEMDHRWIGACPDKDCPRNPKR